ncbi:RHS repeat-associated core domain-containing protein, partial [Lonsdalea quercina]
GWETDFVSSAPNGAPQALYDSEGELRWQAPKATLWGQRTVAETESADPGLAFAGQLRDSESGLCYNRFRYYDPAGGGYISPDPIGLAGGINLYAYAPNPLKWIDPLGLTGCSITRGSDVTPEVVQNALKGDPMQTVQGTVSLPAVQRYVDRLLKGDIAPPIKVDGNVIVEGNHRYVAGKVVGILPEQVPGALSPSNVPRIKPISETVVDLFDWGNH